MFRWLFRRKQTVPSAPSMSEEGRRARELVGRVHYDLLNGESCDFDYRDRISYLRNVAPNLDPQVIVEVLSLTEDSARDDSKEAPWRDWNYAIVEIVANWCRAKPEEAAETLFPGLETAHYREIALQAIGMVRLIDGVLLNRHVEFVSRLLRRLGENDGTVPPLREWEVWGLISIIERLDGFGLNANEKLVQLEGLITDFPEYAEQVEYVRKALEDMDRGETRPGP